MPQDALGGAELHELAGIKHADAVRDLRNRAKIVRDEEDRRADLAAKCAHELEHLRLDDHVERRRRLVHQKHVGLASKCHRDHGALPHAARKLVRVGSVRPLRLVELDRAQELERALARPALSETEVPLQHLRDLSAHC